MCRQITDSDHQSSDYFFITELFNFGRYPVLALLNLALLASLFFSVNIAVGREIWNEKGAVRLSFVYFLKNCWKCLTASALIIAIIWLQNGWSTFLLIVTLPFIFLLFAVLNEKKNDQEGNSIKRLFALAGTDFWKFIGLFYLLGLLVFMFFLLIDSRIVYTYFEIVCSNFVMDSGTSHSVFIASMAFLSVACLGLVFPIVIAGMALLYYSLNEIRFATSLRFRIRMLGNGKGKKELSTLP
jgi:predicted transporter